MRALPKTFGGAFFINKTLNDNSLYPESRNSSAKSRNSSKIAGADIASNLKNTTFAPELIRGVFLNSHNSLVISFSVINYVVSMRCLT